MDAILERLQTTVQSALQGLSPQQLAWHPPDKWCAAQILEHLFLSYTGTAKGFQKMLEAESPVFARGSFAQRSRALFVFTFGYIPSGREAPASTRPRGMPLENVRNEFGEKLAAMDAVIAEAELRFGKGTRLLAHPFLGPLSGPQWRKFHLLHGSHHARQILRLRQAMRGKYLV